MTAPRSAKVLAPVPAHRALRRWPGLIEAEARLKLDSPNLTLDLNPIHAADVAGRARSPGRRSSKPAWTPIDAAANTGVVTTRPLERPEPSQGGV